MTKVLIVDSAQCDGCHACEAACSTLKEGESNPFKSRIRAIALPEEFCFYPKVCIQCAVPLCSLPCPTAALKKNPQTGMVALDQNLCVGCKMCLMACPFGAIIAVDNFPAKCDLCGGDPICVKHCEPRAIILGEAPGVAALERLVLGDRVWEHYLAAGR